MEPLISVIVPIYKVEQYLDECVQSIINQTYKNLEIILVDDGSPDRCPEMCDEYARQDSRIKLIHKKNEGISVARNVGIKVSTGEWLFFIDSDDKISHNCIETLYQQVNYYPDVQMIVGYYAQFEGLQDLSKCNFVDDYIEDPTNKVFLQKHLNGEMYVMAWNKLVKKNFVLENSLFFEPGLVNEDSLWSFMVACCLEKTSFVREVTYYYRIRQNSIMRSLKGKDKEKHKWYSKILLLQMDYAFSKNLEGDWDLFWFFYYSIHHSLFLPIQKSFPEESYQFYLQLRDNKYWSFSQLKSFGLPRRICFQTLHRYLPKRLGYKFYCILFPKLQK